MANTARQFVAEELAHGDDSRLTNNIDDIVADADKVVIHGAWLPVLWKVAKRAKSVGAKLVIRPAGSYDPVRLAYHAWKKRLVAFFEHRMLRRADVVLATCAAEAEWIRAYEPKAKTIEITDLKRFFDLSRKERKVRKEGESLHLLYLGRRHPLKGLEYLQTAVRQIKESFAAKIELKMESSVFGSEKDRLWDWCDVLVLPTLSENFGRVVAEALERGKRVITTDGAPAWSPSASATGGQDDGNDYSGRLTYLKGYRDGTNDDRVRLLAAAIWDLTKSE